MAELRPAASVAPASWLVRSDVDWWDLVRYGPPGFAVYARIPLTAEVAGVQPSDEDPALREVLRLLAGFTSTPDRAFAAIWEGWTSRRAAPEAPRIAIPERDMLLFTGPLDLMRDAPSLAWHGVVQGEVEPHLVWPEDRAWCMACEVDEEVEFTVGCSVEAAEALAAALAGAVRRVGYGDPAPLLRAEDDLR